MAAWAHAPSARMELGELQEVADWILGTVLETLFDELALARVMMPDADRAFVQEAMTDTSMVKSSHGLANSV
jgi:hypothetical protein